MNPNKSTMGRRQFMIAAGLTSTSALVLDKLAKLTGAGLSTGSAMAADKPGTGGMKTGTARYSHLLAPLRIGNVILKNRLMANRALPNIFFNAPEAYPNEQMISYVSTIARNGAAIVTVYVGKFDLKDKTVQYYVKQLTDAIHFYGAKADVSLTQMTEPDGYGISDIYDIRTRPNMGTYVAESKEIPIDILQKYIKGLATSAKRYQDLGFDMACLYMNFQNSILGDALSPIWNKRKDQYGGSLENRARLCTELCQLIKKGCGRDFLIDGQIDGEEEGGYTTDDVVKYTKLWEGLVDILQIRGKNGEVQHPMGYNSSKYKPVALPYAEAVKKSGVKMITAPVGGFHDPDLAEEFIASGKTDMIGLARAFICDPEYGKKVYEGRGEDIVPCLMDNRCHGGLCSVNPKFAYPHKIDRMIDAPSSSRKVAVIGGGPAGMKAALTAAERGHKVTMYEKSSSLGGLLRHSDFYSFQWPVRDYKDYLIRQINKKGVKVLLNTTASRDMIQAGGYDTIVVAVGADPAMPKMSGADGSNVYNFTKVYGNEKALGKNVVVLVGEGGLYGTQTAIHLAEKGHRVTVLVTGTILAVTEGAHSQLPESTYKDLDFSYILETMPMRISEGKVFYTAVKEGEKFIPADSVVIYSGFKPKLDEVMKFSGSAAQFFAVGDCTGEGGNVQKVTHQAFKAASLI